MRDDFFRNVPYLIYHRKMEILFHSYDISNSKGEYVKVPHLWQIYY
jgi:hypothetical protein